MHCYFPNENPILDFYIRDLGSSKAQEHLDNGRKVAVPFSESEYYFVTMGDKDGCIIGEEIAFSAVEDVFDQNMCPANAALEDVLWQNYNVQVPWVLRNRTNCTNSIEKQIVNEITKEIENQFGNLSVYDAQNAISQKLFSLVTSENPNYQNLWKLFAYYKLANFNVTFAHIKTDLFGNHLDYHIALTLNLGRGHETVIVDPLYSKFDIDHKEFEPINNHEALAFHAIHESLKNRNSGRQLNFASFAMPTNVEIRIFQMMNSNLANPIADEDRDQKIIQRARQKLIQENQ